MHVCAIPLPSVKLIVQNHHGNHIEPLDIWFKLPSKSVKQGQQHNPNRVFFFYCGAATQRGSWPPHSRGFYITHNDAPHSVGLLWMSDQLVTETFTWQHTTLTTDKLSCPGWDSNPDLSRQAAAHLRLRPRGHWDRPETIYIYIYLPYLYITRIHCQALTKLFSFIYSSETRHL